MFQHAHFYLALKWFKSRNALLCVGSFLPDIAITGIISWDKGLHGKKNVEKFYGFVAKQYPSHLDLYRGILAHNVLDNFTHEEYKDKVGYAYQNNETLAKLVKKYYHLDEKKAARIAHNYIESGVDINLLKKKPEILRQIRKAIQKVDKSELASLLASYFDVDAQKFENALSIFFEVFTKHDFTKAEGWISFWEDLEGPLSLKSISQKEKRELLDTSLVITAPTYSVFLNYSFKEGLKKIAGYKVG